MLVLLHAVASWHSSRFRCYSLSVENFWSGSFLCIFFSWGQILDCEVSVESAGWHDVFWGLKVDLSHTKHDSGVLLLAKMVLYSAVIFFFFLEPENSCLLFRFGVSCVCSLSPCDVVLFLGKNFYFFQWYSKLELGLFFCKFISCVISRRTILCRNLLFVNIILCQVIFCSICSKVFLHNVN